MKQLTRRELLRTGALGLAATAASPALKAWSTAVPLFKSDLILRPYPHPLTEKVDWAYLTDTNGDPFKAPVEISAEGIRVPTSVDQPFTVNAKMFVEGFGNVWLGADNGGRLFTADDLAAGRALNLNYEFARSRVARNREVMNRYVNERAKLSTETVHLQSLAEELLDEASRSSGEAQAALSDKSLLYALWAGEKTELDKAHWDIAANKKKEEFFFGCETRQYIWAKSVDMVDRFVELFNYATLTHYTYDTWYPVFEPYEGYHRFGIKDEIVAWLKEHEITIEGRPLFWFHPWVMPDWMREKNVDQLKDYVVRHTKEVVGHYGDDVLHWEVVNEYHDWANEFRHTPDEITDIIRLACETTHEVNPKVSRLINNCCLWSEYVARGRDSAGEVDRPLRSVRQFVQDITEAEVPYEVLGLQVYFPQRDLSDIVRLLEKFAVFGKPIYITEIGASAGPTNEDVRTGTMSVRGAPYDWHRPWDEDLQADWLEQVYTVLYSKPYIHNICWYDFADFRTFIQNGGLIKLDGTRKESFHRLEGMLTEWDRLPPKRERNVTGGPRG